RTSGGSCWPMALAAKASTAREQHFFKARCFIQCCSQGAQEVQQVGLFLFRILDIEAAVVEIDQFTQGTGRAIGEEGQPCREATHLLDDNGADVVATSGNQGPTWILG